MNNHGMKIDATIHRFKFVFDFCCRFLQRKMLDDYGIEVNDPKPVLQQAYSLKIIDDEQIWLDMLYDRNMTSHTYKQALADQIYKNIKTYVPFLQNALKKITT